MSVISPGNQTSLLGASSLIGAFALLCIAILMGANPEAFWNMRAVAIVIGGTMLVTSASFNRIEFVSAIKSIATLIKSGPASQSKTAQNILEIAEAARHKSKQNLSKFSNYLKTHTELAHAIELLSDGIDPTQVDRMFNEEMQTVVSQAKINARVFRRAAEIAPAMGLIGTLIGLVQMLGVLSDPKAIGPAMAIALLTTLYGTILAHMVLVPIATKIENDAARQIATLSLYRVGAVSISRKENPRKLELMINAMLPPAERVKYFN